MRQGEPHVGSLRVWVLASALLPMFACGGGGATGGATGEGTSGECQPGQISPSLSVSADTTDSHGLAVVSAYKVNRGVDEVTLDFDSGLVARVSCSLWGIHLPVVIGQQVEADVHVHEEVFESWGQGLQLRDLDGSLIAAVWAYSDAKPPAELGSLKATYRDSECPPEPDDCGDVVGRVLELASKEGQRVRVAPGREAMLGPYRVANGSSSSRYLAMNDECNDGSWSFVLGYVVAEHPARGTTQGDAGAPDAGDEDALDGGRADAGSGAAYRGACRADRSGPVLVEVPAPAGATVDSYCVDATEVTNAHYREFLRAHRPLTTTSAECAWNRTYAPDSVEDCAGLYDPAARADFPVVCVDWCDARAYCAWAGKRLCGRIGGGENAYDDWADADKDEWMNACSAGGTTDFPYGGTFDPACEARSASAPVGTNAACEGGYPGLHDLSGNVDEWEDSCTSGDFDVQCRTRGGNFYAEQDGLMCKGNGSHYREGTSSTLGFRCCASR